MAGNSLDYDGRISLEDYTKAASQNAHQKRRLELIERLLNKVENPGRGLDYGCGLGDLTYRVSPRFDNIVGVDISPERVEWANNEFAPIKFSACKEGILDFPDNSFDLVLSSVVINWVPDPVSYLTEINRALDTNGKLILLVKSMGKMRKILKGLKGQSTLPRENSGDLYIDDMISYLEKANFEICNVDCYYEPPQDIHRNLKNLVMEALILPMRFLKIPAYAHYYGILAQKRNS